MSTKEISENAIIAQEYKNLLRNTYLSLSPADIKLIRLAFETAVDAHKEQRRKSGEPYILHPIAVAQIVADQIGLGATSIAAALLHDVVEDTSLTLEDIELMFGKSVAKIVDGLTKISKLSKDKRVSVQAENFKKMLLTMNDDVRVILIKIGDRLHNMMTLEFMPEEKQVRIASETLYIYAPLAHRIGMYNIKTQLEDLAFKYTEPDVYDAIEQKIKESEEEQLDYINSFSEQLQNHLAKERVKFITEGRFKSIFSIRRKMQLKNKRFDEVFDRFAVRIIYKSTPKQEKFLAWKIYSIITDHFQPNPTRLRDWISSPKSTGYEALHITVVGPGSKWVEVQIRSERMHEIAEKGYAAHFKYKHGDQNEGGMELWLNRLREVLESQDTDAVDFVKEFKLNLYASEIFVFTPKGDLKSLPKGATPVDFAFSIHSEVGRKTRGARVNGKIVPLNFELNSGDQVEIITSETAKPTSSWLDYVITSKARSAIRTALRTEEREIADEGKELLRRKLRQMKFKFNDRIINAMVSYFKLKTSLDLYYRIGIGTIDNKMLKKFAAEENSRFWQLFKRRPSDKTKQNDVNGGPISSFYDMLVFGKNQETLDYTLSPCCNPIAGDEVFGFVSINDGIKVHKNECPNAISLHSNYGYRIVSAKWVDSSKGFFTGSIRLSGIDRLGLVNEVTNLISNAHNVDITQIHFDTENGTFTGEIKLHVRHASTLYVLINKLEKVTGIDKVVRD
ncbi:MAG: bifunctional (p)ppGpp synthetase/guanosine-3',5'-bis(diphosphate) 3'-pyrophosphohydrolase [Flavobacteriales bacterium]|nr:MAG: bifunctional (p)ppGpp synthetase/guanosine-3',5'-bis(diphosphate) 3'-pyrophosphohydrolase [Flavobacteriales bacterium]